MATRKVNAESTWPSVIDLNRQLTQRGQVLEYAVVEETDGRVTGYKPVNEMLVIVPKPRETLPGLTADNALQVLNTDYYNRQLEQFSKAPQVNNRLLYFGLGLAVLAMVVVYSRKPGRA